jgi:hypothetical protein
LGIEIFQPARAPDKDFQASADTLSAQLAIGRSQVVKNCDSDFLDVVLKLAIHFRICRRGMIFSVGQSSFDEFERLGKTFDRRRGGAPKHLNAAQPSMHLGALDRLNGGFFRDLYPSTIEVACLVKLTELDMGLSQA